MDDDIPILLVVDTKPSRIYILVFKLQQNITHFDALILEEKQAP